MKKIHVTRGIIGICHMQVCVEGEATDKEILDVCNQEYPSGTSNGWSEIIRSGEGGPVTCHEDPQRTHYLAVC